MANLLSTIVSGRLSIGSSSTTPYLTEALDGIVFGGNEVGYAYRLYTQKENYGGDYTKLNIAWHTGIKIGAYYGYGGIRFYNNSPASGTEVFSVAKGDSHVRVENNLYVGNTIYNNGNAVIHAGNIGSQSVNYATTAGSAPANGGTSTYATYLNPLSGDGNYKLAYTADGARTNAGEWGRAVMYYVPNGQTYGIRVDRADYSDNSGALGGLGVGSFLRDDGWNTYPGQDANTQGEMRVDFTYSNNAPYTGELIRFGSSGYSTQFNTSYGNSDNFAFRTRNGDNATWNAWRSVIHSGNIASQSVSYAVTSGTSSATTQTNFSELSIGGLGVATREYVTSQGYLTSLPSHNHDDRYLVKGGSWYGSGLPGSRWGGFSVSGGEIVFGDGLPNAGQMGILIDGAYLAGENNGFWSLPSDNSWSGRRGMYWDGSNLNFTANSPTALFNSIRLSTSTNNGTISGANEWGMRITTDSGYIQFGPANGSWAHIYSNLNFYMNTHLWISGGYKVTAWDYNNGGGALYASVFYDANDTSYYVDPNALSRIERLQVVSNWGGSTPNDGQINIRGNYPSMTFRNTISGNMWLRHMDGAGDIQHYFAPSGVDATDWSIKHSMRTDGTFQSNGSMRAPIFYDSQDTAYYGDFASTSRFNATITNTTYFGADTNKGYAQGWNTYSSTLHKIAYVSFDWNGNYDTYSNHGISSTDFAGNFADSISINSFNDITFRLDSNGNNGASYVRFMNDTTGNNTFSSIGYDGSTYYASFSRDLYVSGNRGGNFGNRLIIGAESTPYTLQDGNLRPTAYLRGAYPVLTLDHTETSNGSHGPTIQFVHNGSATNNRQWVIGTNGTGTQLDFGYSDGSNNSSFNPHNGIADYLGTTWMRLDSSGNITKVGSYQLRNGFVIGQGGSNYGVFNSWVRLDGHYGFYAPSHNNAHIYPNDQSYGAWRIIGTRNGWNGINFDASNGYVTLMVNPSSNTTGFHNQSVGWQFYWEGGTLYCFKNTYGGGTQATVLDTSNFTNWAAASSGNTGVEFGSRSLFFSTTNYDFTLAPRASISSMSIKLWDNYFNGSGLGSDYGSLLDIYGRGAHVHSQFYMDANNGIWYRSSPYAGGWNSWAQFLTAANFTTWAQEKENQRLSTSSDVTHNSTTSATILVNNQSDNTKGYRIWNTSNTSVSAMFVNSSNQLVIAAGAVDQVNLNKKVYVNGVALGVNVAPSATAGRIDASNDIVAYSTSDERFKENITPISNALDKVKTLTGVEFDWRMETKDYHGYVGHDVGVIAQQVKAVLPEAVRTNANGYLAVRYEKLIGLLIEANKELAARVEELEKKLS